MKNARQRRKRKKGVVALITLIQVVILVYLNITKYQDFLFAKVLTVLIFIINTMMFLIKVLIVDSTIAIKNDPGIKIWWLCGLQFG